MTDKLYDRGYLVIDGIDGKAHYVTLNTKVELEQYRVVVKTRGSADIRIAALVVDDLYHTDRHLTMTKVQITSERDPKEVVDVHVRRLEALHRVGIVERMAEGVWCVTGSYHRSVQLANGRFAMLDDGMSFSLVP